MDGVLGEAKACGCIAVVSEKATALCETAGDCRFYVPYGDAEATAEAIKKALATPEELKGQDNTWKTFTMERREYGPIDKTSMRGTEKPIPWVLVRREIIQEEYPQMDTYSLDFLAKETAGMYGDEICVAVEEYLRKGQILDNPPDFKFRDPITGEYNELEFNPYNLERSLEKNGFSAEILRPYFPKRPPLTPKCILLNLAIDTIRALHPLSIVVAPYFEIKAVKK